MGCRQAAGGVGEYEATLDEILRPPNEFHRLIGKIAGEIQGRLSAMDRAGKSDDAGAEWAPQGHLEIEDAGAVEPRPHDPALSGSEQVAEEIAPIPLMKLNRDVSRDLTGKLQAADPGTREIWGRRTRALPRAKVSLFEAVEEDRSRGLDTESHRAQHESQNRRHTLQKL